MLSAFDILSVVICVQQGCFDVVLCEGMLDDDDRSPIPKDAAVTRVSIEESAA